jgi:hypothetical protein
MKTSKAKSSKEKPRKGTPQVEIIRRELRESNPLMLADFDELVKKKPGVSCIHGFLTELGYHLSYSAVWHWYQSKHPAQFTPDEVMMQRAQDLDRLIQSLMTGGAVPDGIKPDMLPGLLRELRSICAQIEERKFIKDRQELELNGIYFAFAEMEEAQKDTAFEPVIRDLKRGVLAKYEGR